MRALRAGAQAASSAAEYEALSNLLRQAWSQAPHALVTPASWGRVLGVLRLLLWAHLVKVLQVQKRKTRQELCGAPLQYMCISATEMGADWAAAP